MFGANKEPSTFSGSFAFAAQVLHCPSMSDTIRIVTRQLSREDVQELNAFLMAQPEIGQVRKRLYLTDAIVPPGTEKIVELIVIYTLSKVGDVVAGDLVGSTIKKIKIWLQKSEGCKHRKVPILGPDGKEVTVVECEEKHPLG
jgi:hypothetical protein